MVDVAVMDGYLATAPTTLVDVDYGVLEAAALMKMRKQSQTRIPVYRQTM